MNSQRVLALALQPDIMKTIKNAQINGAEVGLGNEEMLSSAKAFSESNEARNPANRTRAFQILANLNSILEDPNASRAQKSNAMFWASEITLSMSMDPEKDKVHDKKLASTSFAMLKQSIEIDGRNEKAKRAYVKYVNNVLSKANFLEMAYITTVLKIDVEKEKANADRIEKSFSQVTYVNNGEVLAAAAK